VRDGSLDPRFFSRANSHPWSASSRIVIWRVTPPGGHDHRPHPLSERGRGTNEH